MLALLDNTVLSNFTSVGRPDLVRLALGEDGATTKAVWDELQAGILIGKLPVQDWSWLPILTLTATEISLYTLFTQYLNAGEASCLAIAESRQGRVLTDDRDARHLAARRNIPVSGTLGLIIRLIDLQALTLVDGDALLARMIQAGYHSPIASLQQLLP